VHVDKLPKPLKNYFGKRWFEIVLFLEQNFRNAIAPMHYKLFEFENDKHPRTDTLQEKVKMLYQRQTSMLNNRSVFAGLQVGNSNGTSLLSFRRYDPSSNANMTLRERIMSQLHDELPGLDPFLKKYIRQFMIPDAELFLRMIRCPNVLALRELAVQHRHLLGGQTTASSVQQPYHLQQTLKFFPIAVQSEILYMLKFVECDDSVYVHSPAIHEAKLVVVPQNLLRRWIRETLEVAARVQTLQTPLQIKCYMFTMQELAGGGVGAFHTFKKLFYTTEAMMNYGSKRAIVFVLLQIRLALLILKNGRVQHSNPLVDLFPELGVQEDLEYQTPVWEGMGTVPWTPGTCLECWPRRDLNEFVLPSKNLFVDVTVTTATTAAVVAGVFTTSAGIDSYENSYTQVQRGVFGDANNVKYQDTKQGMDRTDIVVGEDYGMLEQERCFWLLLLYARPCLQHFTAEDMTSVCQMRYVTEDGRKFTKDVIVAKLVYRILDNKLLCTIDDDHDAPLFFEKMTSTQEARKSVQGELFPDYMQAIIGTLPDRRYIYVPTIFAKELRKQRQEQAPLYARVFRFADSNWQMVCVGTRAWAWKRLMVKSIFFDAFAKVMTRSSVQLCLYGPIAYDVDEIQIQHVNQKKDAQKQIDRHKMTSSVFGDLPYKLDLLRRNNTNKHVQLVFTEHTKKRRLGRVGTGMTKFEEDKISSTRRQIEFVKYCNNHMETIKLTQSCRFMLVDKRIVLRFLPNCGWCDTKPQDGVLLYRSYLYCLTPITDMLVCFRDQLYIKFPKDYAVIRTSDTYATGPMNIETIDYKYATCFDTRTYSCILPKLRRKADSADMMQMITECTDGPLSCLPRVAWPSTNDMTEQSKSWIYQKDKNVMISKWVSSVIPKDLEARTDLTLADQQNMYTLPDLFSQEEDKQRNVIAFCRSDGRSKEQTWTENIEDWKKDKENIDMWMSLRCTTRTIASNTGVLQEVDRNIDHEFLKPLLRHIRCGMLSAASLDKS
jgi:hypothetical protein